jgi:drug/metabolite transporter (DMT)-like permease
MDALQVTPRAARFRLDPKMALSFFAIYVIWGSTYLAIRFAVADVPPVFAAGVRFVIAGTALYFWIKRKGVESPSRVQWRNLALLGGLMFLIAYSCVFWAETRIPSGIAAVLVATTPMWTTLLEVFALKQIAWRWSLLAAILLGLGGVGVLAWTSGGGEFNVLPCFAVLLSSMSWSAGSVLSKRLELPSSMALLAACEMMLGGSMLLVLSLAIREVPPAPHLTPASLLALGYLIVAGSLLAFTAYVWLLAHLPATKVASYAYVNPLVALVLGHLFGKEAFGVPALGAAALILCSVILILRTKKNA